MSFFVDQNHLIFQSNSQKLINRVKISTIQEALFCLYKSSMHQIKDKETNDILYDVRQSKKKYRPI